MAIKFLQGVASVGMKGVSKANKHFKDKKTTKTKKEPKVGKKSEDMDVDHTLREVRSIMKSMPEYKNMTPKQRKEFDKQFRIEPK